MSGLDIDWSLAIGAIVFAAIATIGWGWRPVVHQARRLVRRMMQLSLRRATRQAVRGEPRAQIKTDTSLTILSRFWVMDGDTVRDTINGVTYRLENIDSPETEDRARCYREREHGKRAKFEALKILQAAGRIEVHATGRIDKYGRSIAFIDVDGRDFGELMIERGFARPWSGQPQVWCGRDGGLELMAKTRSAEFACKTCGAGAFRPASVIKFPTVYRRKSDPPQP